MRERIHLVTAECSVGEALQVGHADIDDGFECPAEARLVEFDRESLDHSGPHESTYPVGRRVGGQANPGTELAPPDSGVDSQDIDDFSVDRVKSFSFLSHIRDSVAKFRRHRTWGSDSLIDMTHVDFILTTARRVREVGAGPALDELRSAGGPAHHHTRTAFTVWAIDRLVAAGLSDLAIVWHPLTDPRSMLAWYDAETLDSADARQHFVPSTKASEGEPAPTDSWLAVAA